MHRTTTRPARVRALVLTALATLVATLTVAGGPAHARTATSRAISLIVR